MKGDLLVWIRYKSVEEASYEATAPRQLPLFSELKPTDSCPIFACYMCQKIGTSFHIFFLIYE